MSRRGTVALAIFTFWPSFYTILLGCAFLGVAIMGLSVGEYSSEPPTIVTFALRLHSLTMLGVLVLLIIYVRHLFKADRAPRDQKALWAAVLVLGNMAAMPVYWNLYMREEPVAPELERISEGDAQQRSSAGTARLMTTKRRWHKQRLIAFLVYNIPILAIWPLAELDYICLSHGFQPVLARGGGGLLDGGTLIWGGIGYQLLSRHQIHVEGDRSGHIVGPQRTIWIMAIYPWFWPFMFRGNTKIVWSDVTISDRAPWTGEMDSDKAPQAIGTTAPNPQH